MIADRCRYGHQPVHQFPRQRFGCVVGIGEPLDVRQRQLGGEQVEQAEQETSRLLIVAGGDIQARLQCRHAGAQQLARALRVRPAAGQQRQATDHPQRPGRAVRRTLAQATPEHQHIGGARSASAPQRCIERGRIGDHGGDQQGQLRALGLFERLQQGIAPLIDKLARRQIAAHLGVYEAQHPALVWLQQARDGRRGRLAIGGQELQFHDRRGERQPVLRDVEDIGQRLGVEIGAGGRQAGMRHEPGQQRNLEQALAERTQPPARRQRLEHTGILLGRC